MKISLGPILSFRGVTTSGWNLCALIVTDIVSNPPELILQSGNKKGTKRAGKLLKALPESHPILRSGASILRLNRLPARSESVTASALWKIPSSCRRATPPPTCFMHPAMGSPV